jgi:Holliday junction DNA helicase RuvB
MFAEKGIDQEGFTPVERKILKALYEADKPIGLDNLSIIANEAPKTLSASIEPFLIRKGLMIRSGKGRIITRKGIDYIEQTTQGGKKARKEIDVNYVRR